MESSSWIERSPDQWQPSEVAEWIRNWAQRNEIQDIEVAHLLYNQMSGSELCQMQREYFTSVCPQYGNMIFDSLHSLLGQFRSTPTTTTSYLSPYHHQHSQQQQPQHQTLTSGQINESIHGETSS